MASLQSMLQVRDAPAAVVVNAAKTLAKRKRTEPASECSGGKCPRLLWGVQAAAQQRTILRLVAPAARWLVRKGDGDTCQVCCKPLGDECVVFTGNSACCAAKHPTTCPLTQPGSMCMSCAAGSIAGGYNRWARMSVGHKAGQPKCPFCTAAVCERDTVRMTKTASP